MKGCRTFIIYDSIIKGEYVHWFKGVQNTVQGYCRSIEFVAIFVPTLHENSLHHSAWYSESYFCFWSSSLAPVFCHRFNYLKGHTILYHSREVDRDTSTSRPPYVHTGSKSFVLKSAYNLTKWAPTLILDYSYSASRRYFWSYWISLLVILMLFRAFLGWSGSFYYSAWAEIFCMY